MAVGIGSQNQLTSYVAGFFEVSFGTYPAAANTNSVFFECFSCSFNKSINRKFPSYIHSGASPVNGGHIESYNIEGSISGIFTYEAAPFLLANVIGDITTTTYGPSYQHTIYRGNLMQGKTHSVSFNVKKGNQVYTFYGGKCSDLSIKMEQNGVMTFDAKYKFIDSTNTGTNLRAYIDNSEQIPIQFDNFTAYSILQIPSFLNLNLISLSYNFKNNFKEITSLGTSRPIQLIPTSRENNSSLIYRHDTNETYGFVESLKSSAQGQSVIASFETGNFGFPGYRALNLIDNYKLLNLPQSDIDDTNNVVKESLFATGHRNMENYNFGSINIINSISSYTS